MKTATRCTLILCVLLLACTSKAAQVDPDLVGTWELMVPNAQGVARWVWDIHADGSYDFHAEGPGGAPAHSGTFSANNGQYTLQSTTLAWTDNGTYHLIHGNTLQATGKLGTGLWLRVQQAQGPSRSEPPAIATAGQGNANFEQSLDTLNAGCRAGVAKESTAATPDGHPGDLSPADIYSYLSKHPFDASLLPAPFKALATAPVEVDAQARKIGLLGVVRTVLQGATSPGAITFNIFRDRAAAEAAYTACATYDSAPFAATIPPSGYVSSHQYKFSNRGAARCLSRFVVGSSSPALVNCYLLVQYPMQEAVIIISAGSERLDGTSNEASHAAIQTADDLLFYGIQYWEKSLPLMANSQH